MHYTTNSSKNLRKTSIWLSHDKLVVYPDNYEKNFCSILLLIALSAGTSAQTEPADLTGLSCVRMTNFGSNTWDFYGDIAVKRYGQGQGRPQRFVRVGEGAYERYSQFDGEWDAVYYFFDFGDGVQIRVLSRPGLVLREENPRASWDEGIFLFAAQCVPLWDRQ
ncbi:MAG: hypothetical protein GQ539_02200 [Sulfitobacter sp.]|nr:hypothetical protein [Sulfitobacter sp.]